MDTCNVVHLVSNSHIHPDNKSHEFKVSFNQPFDLSGKQVALTDITLTKSQPNVLNEKITFSFQTPKPKASTNIKEVQLLGSYPKPALSKRSWKDFKQTFFDSLGSSVKTPEGQDLMKVSHIPSSNLRDHTTFFGFQNLSTEHCILTFYSYSDGSEGWQYIDSELQNGAGPIRDGAKGKEQIKFKLEPKSVLQIQLKISASKFNEICEGNSSHFQDFRIATQFRLSCKYTTYTHAPTPKDIEFQPGEGYFNTIEHLIKYFNSKVKFKRLAMLLYKNGKVVFKINKRHGIKDVNIGGFKHHFGFDNQLLNGKKARHLADRPPDLTGGTRQFYIYCSLVKNVAINELMLPVMATVDATVGTYGEQVRHKLHYPLFLNCVNGSQQQISVKIADDTGNSKGLIMGTTKLTLAVRDCT
jgi:hypothetical protein